VCGHSATIKTLSDNASSIKTTLILVGVADSVDELIGEHQSIERAIKQVPMPPDVETGVAANRG
jgi:hypothetical protein